MYLLNFLAVCTNIVVRTAVVALDSPGINTEHGRQTGFSAYNTAHVEL